MTVSQGQNVSVTLRKADVSDRDDILAWRNDPETRAHSLSTQPVKPDEHEQWFARALESNDRLLLIGCLQGRKIGIVRYDQLKEGSYEVHINLAPAMRGQGLGAVLLKQSLSWVKGKVQARIKRNNTASARAFKKAGYRSVKEDGDILIFEIDPVLRKDTKPC